jgi:hypothetical protein
VNGNGSDTPPSQTVNGYRVVPMITHLPGGPGLGSILGNGW